MAKRTARLNSQELKIIKSNLIKRDGCKCSICGKDLPENKLVVDHKDNDFTNNNADNIQLASQSCNIKKNPPYSGKRDIDFACVRESVSTDEAPKPRSAEMDRNMKSEPKFRDWIIKEMKKYFRMDLNDVIDSGAEYAGVSVDTIRDRYLKKLTSRLGPFRIVEEMGVKILEWKPECFPFKEEMKKYNQ
jgi:hypothetical protein